MTERESLRIVVSGHVDHGKSTVVGRLLADTNSLPQGKLEQVKALCERTSRPFEYAFLLDALKDEQSQGITIDAARIFFKTAKRDYIIIDAPGHIEFLKNMVSGASQASAALLVIDAHEGIRENSRRHGTLLSLLGIRQIAVLINKMDLVDYSQETFDALVAEYQTFLRKLEIRATHFIPISGFHGDNISQPSAKMPWHKGHTVLSALDSFASERPPVDKPFRMPVQDVYKFTQMGDRRRIVAGTISSGEVRPGDEVVFYPSGKSSVVETIETFPAKKVTTAAAGAATGITLAEQIYVRRGELAARRQDPPPQIATRLRASLFWLGREPLAAGKEYALKLGTARVQARLEKVLRILDASTLDAREDQALVRRNEVADCIFSLAQPVALDLAEQNIHTGRFVLVDEFEIGGGGLVREAFQDYQAWLREKVMLRDLKWQKSFVAAAERSARYRQKSALVLITGPRQSNRKEVARLLETKLFEEGRFVYFLGIGSVLYGVDADIRGSAAGSMEHREDMRRLAEVAHILLEAGLILIVSGAEICQEDLDIISTAVGPEQLETVWVGGQVTTDLPGCTLAQDEDSSAAAGRIKSRLEQRGFIEPLSRPVAEA